MGRRHRFWLRAGAALLFFAIGTAAQAADADRPVLIFTDAAIAGFKARLPGDSEAQHRWRNVQSAADRAIKGKYAFGRDGEAALRALALAYRVTGKPAYADAAKSILESMAAHADWLTDRPLANRAPRWNSDLGMGFAAASFGIAYDAIRDALTPAERERLSSGLLRAALAPIMRDWVDGTTRIHSLDTMGHNWWGHIVFGGGVGALAIVRDQPQALEWSRRIDRAGAEWFRFDGNRMESRPATYGADGSNFESVNYDELGLHHLLLFRRAWKTAMQEKPTPLPHLDDAAQFLLQTAYPRTGGAVSLNFGDGAPHACGCEAIADLWAMGDRRPEYGWYLAQFAADPKHDVWADPINLPSLPTPAERQRAQQAPSLPTARAFSDSGWLMMRDSWASDATLFALRSGQVWNHAHADAGGFVLHHRGVNLLIDSGNSSYGTPEYDGYYRQSRAHNVVTLDGVGSPPSMLYDGSHFTGTVAHLIEGRDLRYAWADATGPTAPTFHRNFRNILWVGGTILIIDDVRGWQAGQAEWLLHYDGAMKRSGQTVRIAQGGAAVDVRPLFPQPLPDAGLPTDYPEAMRMVLHDGLRDHAPKDVVPYLGFQQGEKSERTKFWVALTPVEDNSPAPVIDRMEGLGWQGVRIRQNGMTTEIYLNLLADGRVRHRNANATLGGFDTDAYILAVSRRDDASGSDGPASIFVADGSYVRRDGKAYIDSLSKLFGHVQIAGASRITLDAQPMLDARFACAGDSVTVDGAATQPCVDGIATIRRP